MAEDLDPNALLLELAELCQNQELTKMGVAASRGFSRVARPLEAVLSILEGSASSKKPADFKLRILVEFSRWLQDHPQVTLASLPEAEAMALRRRALAQLTERLPGVVGLMVDIYGLKLMERTELTQHVARLQALNLHTVAVVFSVKMELQRTLDMEEMCVPLLLQDKVTVAESFVSGHPDLEVRLVSLLDSWCDPGFTPDTVTRLYPGLARNQFQRDQLRPKILSKHVFRLMGRFNVNPARCHNSIHMRKKGTLKFLMERYLRKDMNVENWRDHTKAIIVDDPEMQTYLEAILPNYCRAKLIGQLTRTFREGPDAQQCSLNDTPQSAEWTAPTSRRFHQPALRRDQVHILDSPEALDGCRDLLFKAGGTVGVDMEWRSGFGCMVPQRVALIQLAVQDRVFILDMCSPGLWQHPDTLAFMRALLCDTTVRKLGYDLGGDLKYLQTTWSLPQPLKTARVLDLHTVHQEMKRVRSKGWVEKGLSQLVQHVLGKPLDKTEQLSYWERRPLHSSQLRYAATDAFCLLEVYSEVSREPARYGLTSDKLAA